MTDDDDRQRESDRLIIKTMRFAVRAIATIMALFVMYIIADWYVASRLGDLQHRVEVLERGASR